MKSNFIHYTMKTIGQPSPNFIPDSQTQRKTSRRLNITGIRNKMN